MIVNILNIVAVSLELIGAIFLANHYLKVRTRKVPKVLFSALFGGEISKRAANLAQLADDDPIISLRGLAFLVLGFFVQLISNIVQMYLNLS